MQTCDERYNCFICDKVVSKRITKNGQYALRKHIKGVHRKALHVHQCDQCEKSFTDKPILQRHIEITHDKVDMKIPCEFCGRTYRHPWLLKSHIKDKHTPNYKTNKIWKCAQCEKEFKNHGGYRTHMRKEHEGERNRFQCETCGKGFLMRGDLQEHIRIVHENERPYKCSYPGCDKDFGYKSSLDVHVERNHAVVKKYICEQCNLPLGNSFLLRQHIQVSLLQVRILQVNFFTTLSLYRLYMKK